MVYRPPGTPLFEFVAVSSLRAAQLMRGALPLVASGLRPTVTAQREVAAGVVRAIDRPPHIATAGPVAVPLLDRVQRSSDSGKDIPREYPRLPARDR